MLRRVCVALTLMVALASANISRAAEREVWLLPTVVQRPGREPALPPTPPPAPAGDAVAPGADAANGANAEPSGAPPPGVSTGEPAGDTATPPQLTSLARELDALLPEALRDFGFEPRAEAPRATARDEAGLIELARTAWVVAPNVEPVGERVLVRLVIVPQGSGVLSVHRQALLPAELEVRSLSMLRQLLEPLLATPGEPREAECPKLPLAPQAEMRSEGRAVLAVHAALLGGFLGFALQRAAGSDDARVTYPLAALGAGMGLGAAVVVADEWDISVARAWYLGAGVVWPGLAGLLLARSYDVKPESERLLYGVLGATGGVALATAGLSLGDVDEGGALMTHTGAALGTLLGGLVDMTIKGSADHNPRRGMGIGALVGVIGAGALASQVHVTDSSDLVFVELSALLGGLAGAALGTPLLVQERSETRDRLWLSAVITGTLAGAVTGYALTGPVLSARGSGNGAGSSYALWPELSLGPSGLGLGVSGAW